jgi:hypothetical protein
MGNPVESVSPNTYKSKYGNKANFSFITYEQLKVILQYGTTAQSDKESLRKFERAVKMLEAFLINFISKEYKDEIRKLIDKCAKVKDNDMNAYYEAVRLRFMYLMKVLNKIQDLVPEEKAMESIGEEIDIVEGNIKEEADEHIEEDDENLVEEKEEDE